MLGGIGKKKKWDSSQLEQAVKQSTSTRQVIKKLGLVPAGGNYFQINFYIKKLGLDISHFKGQGWNKGNSYPKTFRNSLDSILTVSSNYQSYKLKNRLFSSNLKKPLCELCGWAKTSEDGRIPLELDHINGIHSDNRLENLRILCPNCHSLQPTHRGRNKLKS
jgi:hypothetical protein